MPTAVHHFSIGDFDGIVIADDIEQMTSARFDGIFNHVGDAAIRDAFAKFPAHEFSFNCMVLRRGGRTMLIDTGEGRHPPRPHGYLLDGLRQAGVSPEEVDAVMLTHFHIDHVGGLVNDAGDLIYPKARLVVTGAEWNYWMRDEMLASLDEHRSQTLRRGLEPYAASDRLDRLDPDGEIAPGISYVSMPGHTPGHAALSIESNGARLLHIADVAHVPLQLKFPDSAPRFDFQPDIAATTRRQIFARAAEDGCLVAAFHFPFPGLGTVTQEQGEFVWNPVFPENVS